MTHPNQFTKALAEGKPVPKAGNQFTTGKRLRHSDETRDKMRSERALKFLDKTVRGKATKGETPTFADRIAAAKAMIPFGKPAMQSVEYSNTDPLQDLNLEEQIDMAKALILAHPEIIQALNLQPAPQEVLTTADIPSQDVAKQG